MSSAEAFYLNDPPTHLQQGDICAGVPILLLPASDELILIRSQHHKQPIDHLEPGAVELVRELGAVADVFESGFEYVAVAAQGIYAMLMTPTCDLDGLEVWSVWPMYGVEDSGRERALAVAPNNIGGVLSEQKT